MSSTTRVSSMGVIAAWLRIPVVTRQLAPAATEIDLEADLLVGGGGGVLSGEAALCGGGGMAGGGQRPG